MCKAPPLSNDISIYSFSLSNIHRLSLQSEEGLRRFQTGDLSPNEEQWYLLVPPEARQVLSKQEITRQSIIFELIQNERDYVRDLELLSEAFIDPLRNVKPIPSHRVESFILERTAASCFTRQQREDYCVRVGDVSLAHHTLWGVIECRFLTIATLATR